LNFGKRLLTFVVLTLATCGAAAAQNFDPTAYFLGFSTMHPSDGRSATASFDMLGARRPRVQNEPFYGELVEQLTRGKADGSQTTHSTYPIKMWRNSEGSFRIERVVFSGIDETSEQLSTVVTICDHVAGMTYVLDVQHRIAHRFPCQPPIAIQRAETQRQTPLTGPRPNVTAPSVPDPSRPARKTESLGQQVIGEVVAEGSRTTTTYPVGFEGNDRPIVVSMETWVSRELKLEVMRKFTDPHVGANLREMKNIRRAEPDAALFQVPSDFTIIDESGPFKFAMTKGGS
jgi:hypothetical protein